MEKLENLNEEIILAPEGENNLFNETYNKFDQIVYKIDELNKFKDNILLLLKERDKIYMNKLLDYKIKADKIKLDFDETNSRANSNFDKIISTQAKLTSRLDQLNSYETFVNKTNDKLISHEVRLNNFREDFTNATQKYDRIYLDNLELPGFIGRCAKYKNCQSFFLDVIKDLAKLNKFRDKNIIDFKMYKEKLETLINSINTLIDNYNDSQMKYIKEEKEKILKDCNKMFESVTENIKEIKVENSKYAVDLIAKSMNLTKKWEDMEKIRDEIFENFNYSVNKYQMLTDDTMKSFDEFKNEYDLIRRKFFELAEFIKDVRFRKNIGENVKKAEIKNVVKKILKKGKPIDGKDIHLLNDISHIENVDFKKYYNIDSRNEEINENISMNQNQNNEKNNYSNNIKSNNYNKINNNSNKKNSNNNNIYSVSNTNDNNNNRNIFLHSSTSNKNKNKISYLSNNEVKINNDTSSTNTNRNMIKKELNQSVDEPKLIKSNIKTPLSTMTNGNMQIDISNKTFSISPMHISSNKSSTKMNRITYNLNNKKEKGKEKEREKDKEKEKEKEKEKVKGKEKENEKEKIKEKGNDKEKNIEKIIEKNKEKDAFLGKLNANLSNSNNITTINNDITNNNTISQIQNEKDIASKDEKGNESNNDFKSVTNNTTIIDKKELFNDLNNINKSIHLKSENKESLDETYSLYEGLNTLNMKNSKLLSSSSEKNISIISESTSNINKFLLNDLKLEHNDKVIKELASELEQSTAKKDKLASNKKEIDQNFKNVCNGIEPINLLSSKIKNKLTDLNPNEKIEEENIQNINTTNNKYNTCDNNSYLENNEILSTNNFNQKINMVDQKILNLELYTKEKIIDLISQINVLKNAYKCLPNDSNKLLGLSSSKYKTFNNSFNGNNQQNFLVPEKLMKENKENTPNNNENKNIINSNNNLASQVILNNIKNEKRRYSLKEINPKPSMNNSKMIKKVNINNVLSESSNNNFVKNFAKNINIRELADGINNRILQSLNNEQTTNQLKSHNSLFLPKSNNAYNSPANTAEIKFVDLNRLVNHQLPRNRLVPIHINEADYFVQLNK